MTELLSATPEGIARAAALLREGKLVAFGTETVYGLGADATKGDAVAAIFAAKQRPRFNPLISHFPDADSAFAHVAATQAARLLAEEFWPGPLTLVLPRLPATPIHDLTGAGLPTLAIRVPASETARALLRSAGLPIAAPSANRSGQVSPTSAQHVLSELDGRIEAILDSGPCAVGLESTILDLSGPRPVLLRPGGISREALEEILGPIARAESDDHAPRAPGMLRSHYAPRLPVRLSATSIAPTEALLAFGPPLTGGCTTFSLSASGDLTEAATRLFAGLRALDATPGASAIAVMPIPHHGLGLALNDRLERAAAPRG